LITGRVYRGERSAVQTFNLDKKALRFGKENFGYWGRAVESSIGEKRRTKSATARALCKKSASWGHSEG